MWWLVTTSCLTIVDALSEESNRQWHRRTMQSSSKNLHQIIIKNCQTKINIKIFECQTNFFCQKQKTRCKNSLNKYEWRLYNAYVRYASGFMETAERGGGWDTSPPAVGQQYYDSYVECIQAWGVKNSCVCTVNDCNTMWRQTCPKLVFQYSPFIIQTYAVPAGIWCLCMLLLFCNFCTWCFSDIHQALEEFWRDWSFLKFYIQFATDIHIYEGRSNLTL